MFLISGSRQTGCVLEDVSVYIPDMYGPFSENIPHSNSSVTRRSTRHVRKSLALCQLTDWPNLSSAASALCGGSLLQHYSRRATSEEECTTGTSHLMSWTCKVSIWQLMKDFFSGRLGGNFITCCSDSLLLFFFSPWQRQTFLPTQCFCEDGASSVEFESVKVEGCYRFDFVYQKKLLTAEQLFCFLPVSCSAAECHRRADMSAFNRPRWSSSGVSCALLLLLYYCGVSDHVMDRN